jgi:flagellin
MGMALAINTNMGSIRAQRNLSGTNRALNQNIQRLSSGLRLNSAADDAAGMAVSTGLRAQLRGYQQALRNTNDGTSILQTTEGAYATIAEMLTRMRELAVQSASDGLGNKDRNYLDTEFQDIIQDLNRISAVTEYNGQKLLDGTAGDGSGNMVFQVGMRNTGNDRITITLAELDASGLGVAATGVSSLALSQSAITIIDNALDTLSIDRTEVGSKLNKLANAATNLGISVENISASDSTIRDVDMASESASFAKQQVLQQAGVAMLSTANQMPNLALRLLG